MWWFLYGLIVGAVVMRIGVWVKEGKISINWYIWVMGVMALVLGTLAVQHFVASRKEMEPRAAWMGLLFLGAPALALASFALWFLLAV
jgi:uncharacterized membrane protein YiaA